MRGRAPRGQPVTLRGTAFPPEGAIPRKSPGRAGTGPRPCGGRRGWAGVVLEHFLDPLRALAGCRAALEPGGRVVVMTPNVDAWAHRLLGRSWSGLHAPRHTHLFNARTLAHAAEKAGFVKAKVETAFVTDPASPVYGSYPTQAGFAAHALADDVRAQARGTSRRVLVACA